MRIQGLVVTTALVCGGWAAHAQDIMEAYNLSNLQSQGTASSIGYGGALGSLGGDFAGISVNPAGLGIYKTSEFTFTPSLKVNGTSSDYLSNTTMDNNTRFNVNNVGFIFNSNSGRHRRRHRNSDWSSVSFAIGMNRMADFNLNSTYSGNNYKNSATQAMAADANDNNANVSTQGTLAYMGYQTFLINQNTTTGLYESAVPISNGTKQVKTIEQRGGINEFLMSLGGSYRDKLMLGISVGIPFVDYERNITYSETALSGAAANPGAFQSFTYGNNLNVYGAGFNVKLGAIYKFNDLLRVGAAFHSPTYYQLTDVSDPSITANSGGYQTSYVVGSGQYDLPENQFNYGFTTPWRGILSATLTLRNLGFVTADYEYVDYSSMRYIYPSGIDENTGYSYQDEETAMNQEIKSNYQAASDVRLGVGIKLTRFLTVRAGAGYYQSPYKTSDFNGDRLDLSAGIGFKANHFFADLGMVHSMYKNEDAPYSIENVTDVPTALTSYNLNNVALTFGVRY